MILGIVPRRIERKLAAAELEYSASLQHMSTLLEGAQRIDKQQPKDKNKFYVYNPRSRMHRQGQAGKLHEFGVKASIVITHKSGLTAGAKTFFGNSPYPS